MRFFWENDWDKLDLAVSSEAVGFSVKNTQHRWKTWAWRSIGCAAESIAGLWPAGEPQPRALIIGSHNLSPGASVQLSLYTGSSPPAYRALLTRAQLYDPIVHYPPLFADTITSVELAFYDPANPAGYLEVGRVFLGQYFEPDRGHHHRRGANPQSTSLVSFSELGQISSVLRPVITAQNYLFQATQDRDKFRAMFYDRGSSRELFICENPAAIDTGKSTRYVRIKSYEEAHVAGGEYWTVEIEFEDLQ